MPSLWKGSTEGTDFILLNFKKVVVWDYPFQKPVLLSLKKVTASVSPIHEDIA